MHSVLADLTYVLRAIIVLKSGEKLKFSHVLDIKRAVYSSDAQVRQSIRTFPPTNLVAKCELPPLLFPIGDCNAELRIDGIVEPDERSKTRRHWKLSRLTWRLEETQKIQCPPCPKHAPKGNKTPVSREQKSRRILRVETMSSGWKSDLLSIDGYIYAEFQVGTRPEARPVCNTKSEDGIDVYHILIVEMTMDEYMSKNKTPTHLSPTSRAQLMRMKFDIIVTERSGLGVSWDEEQPPLYEQVPASPPAYANTEVIEESPADYESLAPLDAAPGEQS